MPFVDMGRMLSDAAEGVGAVRRTSSVRLHLISAGTCYEDGGSLFGLVPKVLWEQVATADEQNRIPLNLRCLLIETDDRRILVDTGYGDKLSAEERSLLGLEDGCPLLHGLEKLGIGPLDVDLVINTHLHTEHCGGNTRYDRNGDWVPTFPRATYCVQRLELADASFPNEWNRANYLPENFEPLERAGQLRTLWGNTRLTDRVQVIVTPGHTRAHQSVVVNCDGQSAIFLGDVACWPVHLERLAWVPAHDAEPLVSIETKRNLARWASENHVLLLFAHHPEIKAGYLQATEQAHRLHPVEFP